MRLSNRPQFLDDRISVLLRRCLSTQISCDVLAFSNRLRILKQIWSGESLKSYRQSSLFDFVRVWVQVHMPEIDPDEVALLRGRNKKFTSTS